MQKPAFRPLRLVSLNVHNSNESDKPESQAQQEEDEPVGELDNAGGLAQPVITIMEEIKVQTPRETIPQGEDEARLLLKRTPTSYLLNQFYGLWVFISLFLITVIVTRKLTVAEYGVYAVAMTAFNTIAYIAALGLEDAMTTYLPRIFSEHGRAAGAALIRRLLLLRTVILAVSLGIMLFAMPTLAFLIAAIPIKGAAQVAVGLRDPTLLSHIAPIAFYVLGNGITSLVTAVCASLMRMRLVFIAGGLAQCVLLVCTFIVLQLGLGTNGVLWLFAATSLLTAVAFLIWLLPLLFARGATYIQPLKPVIQLGISAWLTNLVSGALLKQTLIILLGFFAVSIVEIGYFNLSAQLAHAASLLLVSGFGGVEGATLAAAFVGRNFDRLARSWQTLIKIETLLAAPVLVFCLFNAQNIALALYGTNYSAVGPLLAIFLFFNLLARVLGTTVHQYALYVTGKPRLVVLCQWLGLLAVIGLGIALIPRWGPAGALVADGLAQMVIGTLMLVFLWNALPRKYPFSFTWRLLLGLSIAALPGILWHPSSRFLIGVSGCIFLVLCLGLLLIIKPLNDEDVTMAALMNTRIARLLRPFARKAGV
ncbi:MAG TPA: polysaccharide biosynthesis C-terminal domain-containing protein [Ktedonobacteraceae bacterium]|nr:polysaccharide biosynthesis C-terminal domain-containing protein [Ktedonobacteraceae bacterium]